jgi:hypothetical protein
MPTWKGTETVLDFLLTNKHHFINFDKLMSIMLVLKNN